MAVIWNYRRQHATTILTIGSRFVSLHIIVQALLRKYLKEKNMLEKNFNNKKKKKKRVNEQCE